VRLLHGYGDHVVGHAVPAETGKERRYAACWLETLEVVPQTLSDVCPDKR